jgi:hypothetical protein
MRELMPAGGKLVLATAAGYFRAPGAEATLWWVPKWTRRVTCQLDPRGVPSMESRLIYSDGDSRCVPRILLGSTLHLVLGQYHNFPSAPRAVLGTAPRSVLGSAPRSVLGSAPRLVFGTPRLVFEISSRLVPTGDSHLAPRLVLGSEPRLAL